MDLKQLNLSNMNMDWLVQKATTYGVKIFTAILIIAIGFWIASKVTGLIRKSLEKTHFTLSLRKVFGDIVSVLLKVLVVLIAMNTAGIEITSIVALLGGLAVGIGMALQGSLANFAGGLLILLFKPYRIGDFIESLDKAGTVEEISLLQTILLTPDMRTVILPNGAVFNNPIINFSKYSVRRVEIGIGISYADDFDQVKEVLMQVFKSEPLMLDDKGYVLEINEFGDNSVNLAMYGYTKTENFLQAKWNLNRATKKALDANGFSIPFPQRDIHVITN